MSERIEGYCYCACGHTAGKHTTPDIKSSDWRCREKGCNCKAYVNTVAHDYDGETEAPAA